MAENLNSLNKSGQRMFRTAAFGGFNKEDVCAYLDVLTREMSIKLKQKEEELQMLDAENKRLRLEKEEMQNEHEKIESDKYAIATILMKAEDSAKRVIETATMEAEKRKHELQATFSMERNKLRALKEELIDLRERASRITRQFEQDLSKLGIAPDDFDDIDDIDKINSFDDFE